MEGVSASIFERLPEELRHSCLSYCDSSTIFHLCLTAKGIYNICVDSLFHTIDLSTHNGDEWCRHKTYSNLHVPPDYVKTLHIERDKVLVQRQSKLISLLENTPEFALKTRALRWTCVVTNSSRSVNDRFNAGTDVLWTTFSHFTKLIELDIGFMTGAARIHPPPIFPFSGVASLSLSGIVSVDVLLTILHSIDASNLKHLRFNNLQTFAEITANLRFRHPATVANHRRDRCGAAWGHFASNLTGRCTSLRSFQYMSTAEFLDGSSPQHPRIQAQWATQVTDEIGRYAELASFIGSVKPTLRELYFEHGPDIDYFGTAFGQRFHDSFAIQNHNHPLPMDRFFDTHVLPVLISGPWPKLQSMIVKGIGHWKPIDAWSEEATPAQVAWLHGKTKAFREKAVDIWEAVPKGCVVEVKDEASRPFYRVQADKAVNGMGTDLQREGF